MSNARIDNRDWSQLSLGERIRQIELEGYLLLPDLLAGDQIAALKQQTSRFDTEAVDYSVHQQYRAHIEFTGGAVTELIAHPATSAFLRELFGGEPILMSYTYARSEPGHPGISLHTDGQPYGSEIFGFEGSCPHLVRVLYYLDDLTRDVSPFRVVPCSHLSMHADANPYKRYASHPEEVLVTARAGSAILINHKVFHGSCPNVGDRSREMLAIGFRPSWAGPIRDVADWDRAEVDRLPAHVRPFFGDRNHRVWDFHGGNRPPDLPHQAPGINSTRWQRK